MDVDNFIQRFSNPTAEDINELTTNVLSFKYEGFNLKVIIEILIKTSIDKKRSLNKDMNILVAYGLSRGVSVNNKNLGRMKVDKRAIIKDVLDAYNIKHTTPETQTDLNLARVLATVPHYMAITLRTLTSMGKRPEGLRIIREDIANQIKLPIFTCFAQFASVIPKSFNVFWDRWLVWHREFSKIMKVTEGKTKREPPNNDADFYVKTARDNEFFTDAMRMQLMAALGIINA